MKLKTSEERLKLRKERQRKQDAKVMDFYNKTLESHSISDSVVITANEFGLSLPTVYNIKNRYRDTRIS